MSPKQGTYRERFDAFAAKAKGFRQCSIMGPDGGRWAAGAPYRVPFGTRPCQCCGNRRLKNIYPVQAEDGTTFLIGCECMKALEKADKLIIEMPWQAPIWEITT